MGLLFCGEEAIIGKYRLSNNDKEIRMISGFLSGGNMVKKWIHYFSKGEWMLWLGSLVLILASFFVFDRADYLTLAASLVGATSLIFNAKGNPLGQGFGIVFSILYGIISFKSAYYGEMITFLGMTMPMAVFSLISWLRNPYHGNKAEVRVRHLTKMDVILLILLTVVVTVAFYFILGVLNTANLIVSTISVATSFAAVFLTFRRSSFYALGYALNDIVLITLWGMSAAAGQSSPSVIICFVVFLLNDLYGFWNWQRIHKRQKSKSGHAV